MSTRATYQFQGASYAPKTYIYIHYDGYEDGAASYFAAMIASPSKGCLATQFIRANDQAELTHGHEAHGDTEFRYTVTGSSIENAGLLVQARGHGWSDKEPERWNAVYTGPLVEFVNKYRRLHDLQLCRVAQEYGGERVMSLQTAETKLREERELLGTWLANGVWTMEAANAQSLAKRIKNLEAAITTTKRSKAA